MKRKNILLLIIIILLQLISSEIYSQSGNAKSLAIGNKWIYESWYGYAGGTLDHSYISQKVIKDTLIYNTTYAVVNHQPYNNNSYERADSMQTYFYSTQYDSEYVSISFSQKDTVIGYLIREVDTIDYWGRSRIRVTEQDGIPGFNQTSDTYIEGIGQVSYGSYGHGGTSSGAEIVAAYLDGVIYGDTTLVESKKEEQIPTKYELYQNYPNPFNSRTIIKFTIPEFTKVMLSIYSINGEKIINLVDKELSQGSYQIGFEDSDICSGIYFYQLQTDKFIKTKKFVYLK